jgi:hypothetical protein
MDDFRAVPERGQLPLDPIEEARAGAGDFAQ